MKKKPYGRRTYPSRGKLPQADRLVEPLLNHQCAICGTTLLRKIIKNVTLYGWGKWLDRKTCGAFWKKGKIRKTKCLKKFIMGEGNPKWRGGLPRCKTCNKRTAWYKNKKKNNPQNYCKSCFNKRLVIIAKENGAKRRGIYPKHLLPYAFKKGKIAKNKLYEDYTQCSANGCLRKPIAQMLCGLHYQRKKR